MTQYRFATTDQDYSDLASGAILRSAPGRPAFPVRLGLELFLRAWHFWQEGLPTRPSACTLYDPCCGAGYLLTVLTLLEWEKIETVIGSDIDSRALELAQQNLSLLTPAGIAARQAQLVSLAQEYGKESHAQHAAGAARLAAGMETHADRRAPQWQLFQADALDGDALAAGLGERRADIVICDVPYGKTTQWEGEQDTSSPEMIGTLLESWHGVLARGAVVVVAGLRAQMKGDAPAPYRQLQRVRIGRREARLWRAE